MRLQGPFQSFLSSGCHGNHNRYEHFDFNFCVNILKLFKGGKFDHDQRKEENVMRI